MGNFAKELSLTRQDRQIGHQTNAYMSDNPVHDMPQSKIRKSLPNKTRNYDSTENFGRLSGIKW